VRAALETLDLCGRLGSFETVGYGVLTSIASVNEAVKPPKVVPNIELTLDRTPETNYQ
jgi:hypothetical protein